MLRLCLIRRSILGETTNEASTSALMDDNTTQLQEEEIADVNAAGNQPHIRMHAVLVD